MPNITGQISRAQELTGNTSGNNHMSGQIQGIRGEKGEKGDKGDTGATGVGIASTTLNSDYTLTIVLTDGTSYTTPSIRGAQGQQGIQGNQGIQGVQGETGNGISSIAKTGTSGLVDTYTVTFTDGTTTTFTVTNGQNGTGSVSDVLQNGVSVLDGNTAKVTVPTKTSDLTNDSNFVADSSYVHTDNNYTTTEKNKLAGIASGAEVNVQSDWNESDSTDDAYIKNKPSIPTKTTDLTNDSNFVADASYVHTDNNFTSTEKTKLSGIAQGAEVNVQANWNETSSSSDAYIRNKPTIPKVSSVTVSLAVANWSNNSQTVSVTGVTASNNVIVSPAPSSIDNYVAAGIKCTAQASNSLTFTCTTTPSTAISVNILIIG